VVPGIAAKRKKYDPNIIQWVGAQILDMAYGCVSSPVQHQKVMAIHCTADQGGNDNKVYNDVCGLLDGMVMVSLIFSLGLLRRCTLLPMSEGDDAKLPVYEV